MVCQTGGRRCLVWPLSLSLSFFQALFFPHWLLYSLNEAHPLSTATQLFSASDGSVGVTLFFLTFSISPYFLHHNTSVHPSIYPGHCWVAILSARSWRTQPLTYASPCWPSAAVVLILVLHAYLSGQGHAQLAFSKKVGGENETHLYCVLTV